MFNYFKMKKSELKVKKAFYDALSKIIEEKADILQMVSSTYEAFKGMSGEEIRDDILGKIAEIIHNSNINNDEEA